MIALLTSLEEQLGADSRFVHIGLTTSDVWDTATALQLRDAADLLIAGQERLRAALATLARRHRDTLTVARTHGVHAEPTTFGLKVAVWYVEAGRNLERLRRAREAIAVGKLSGAVGTFAHVAPEIEEEVCRDLGLGVEPVSTQIIQRDRHAEFVSALAIAGASLEKIALEVRGLQRTEVLEAEEPFGEGQKGSSAMPHKRNPELAERICGLARLLRTNALAALENVALWHERDISHSSVERVILPDSTILLDYMLDLTTFIVEGLERRPGPHGREPRPEPGPHLLPARAAQAHRVRAGAPGGLRAGAASRDAGVARAAAVPRAAGRRSGSHRAAGRRPS